MKKYLLFTMAAIASACMVGCEEPGLLAKIGMDTDGAVEKVAEVYKSNVDTASYKPVRIIWMEDEEIINDLGYIVVEVVGKDGKLYSQDFDWHNGFKPKSVVKIGDRHEYEFETIHWLQPNDVDFKLVKKHHEAAKAQIPEEGNYKFMAIVDYEISVNPQTGKKKYLFTMSVVEKVKKISIKKGRIDPEWYDMRYEGFEDGTVKYLSNN